MAERPPSSAAGGGESSAPQVPNPPPQEEIASSTAATSTVVSPMMILQQQQQQLQQERPRQQPQQLQQRVATTVGRRRQQQQQQIRQAGPSQQQQQQNEYPTPYEAYGNVQGPRPGPQGSSSVAGTSQQQNMQESSPWTDPGTDRLRNYAASVRGINPYSIVEAPSILDRYPTAFPSLHELSEMTARWAAERDHRKQASLPPDTTKQAQTNLQGASTSQNLQGASTSQNLQGASTSRQGSTLPRLTSQQQQQPVQKQSVTEQLKQILDQALQFWGDHHEVAAQNKRIQELFKSQYGRHPGFSPFLTYTTVFKNRPGPRARINPINGYPHRPGQKLCKPFAKGEICTYGPDCLFHHPWPREPWPYPDEKPEDQASTSTQAIVPLTSSQHRPQQQRPVLQLQQRPVQQQQRPVLQLQQRPVQQQQWPVQQLQVPQPILQSQNQPQFPPWPQMATRGTPAWINPNNGLPDRPGASLCKAYASGQVCRFGTSCLFHHPWPRAPLHPVTPLLQHTILQRKPEEKPEENAEEKKPEEKKD